MMYVDALIVKLQQELGVFNEKQVQRIRLAMATYVLAAVHDTKVAKEAMTAACEGIAVKT